CYLAMKGEVGHRRYTKDSVDPGLDAKGSVLRHIDPDPDHVAALQRKHRGAARRVGCDQAASIDVALRDHAVEGSDDLLVNLLLIDRLQLLLHRRSIVLSRRRRVA